MGQFTQIQSTSTISITCLFTSIVTVPLKTCFSYLFCDNRFRKFPKKKFECAGQQRHVVRVQTAVVLVVDLKSQRLKKK